LREIETVKLQAKSELREPQTLSPRPTFRFDVDRHTARRG
jgi:hypothetical protein